MKDVPRWFQLLVVGLTLIALVLFAAGLPSIDLRRGRLFEPETVQELQSLLQSFRLYERVWLLLLVILPLALLWLARWRRRPMMRVMPAKRSSLWVTLLQFVLWTAAFLLIRQRLTKDAWRFELPNNAAFEALETAKGFHAPELVFPTWLSYLVTFLLLFVLLVIMGFFWLKRSRKRQVVLRLEQEAREALHAIDRGDAVYSTVVQCYLRMVQVVHQRRGLRRGVSVTAHEFSAALVALGLPHAAVHQLTRLFEKARYSNQLAGEQDALDARASLNAIITALEGES